jgi:hypothetical protein
VISLYDQNGGQISDPPNARPSLRLPTMRNERCGHSATPLLLRAAGFRFALTADRVDLKDGTLVFERLKKRRAGILRPVKRQLVERMRV